MTIVLRVVDVNEDGTETILAEFPSGAIAPPVDPPTEPPKEDDQVWAVVTSDFVNTRENPNTGGTPIQLLKGRNIFIKKVPPETAGYDPKWVWWQIELSNGDTSQFKGRYVAEKSADGKTVFLNIKESEDVFEPLWEIVEKNYEGQIAYHFNDVKEENSTRGVGMNMREFAHWEYINPPRIQIDRSQVPHIRDKNLDKLNHRKDGVLQSGNVRFLRVSWHWRDLSDEENLKAVRAMLERVKQQRYTYQGKNVQLIKVWLVLNDSLVDWSASGFYPKGEEIYHTDTGLRHLNPSYWTGDRYKDHFEPLIRKNLQKVVEGYEDVVAGFELWNEPQLGVGKRTITNARAFERGVRYMSDVVNEVTHGQFPINIGLRTSWDVTPNESINPTTKRAWTQQEWAKELYKDLPNIKAVTAHLYFDEDVIDPKALCIDEDKAVIDYLVSIDPEIKKVFMITEFGTPNKLRDGLLFDQRDLARNFLHRWFDIRKIYAVFWWAFIFHETDFGADDKDHSLGWATAPQKAPREFEVVSHYAWNVLFQEG